jgi:hypothetical protein
LTELNDIRSIRFIMCDNRTPFGQAAHLIDRLSVTEIAQITGRSASRVRSWRRSKASGGSDGLLPSDALAALWIANDAKSLGLSFEDFGPRPVTLSHNSINQATASDGP